MQKMKLQIKDWIYFNYNLWNWTWIQNNQILHFTLYIKYYILYLKHILTFFHRFEFHVIPDIFIVHQPHAPSLDISRYRSNPHYRRLV